MNYFSDYKDRVLKGSTNEKEFIRNDAIRTFEEYLSTAPTAKYIKITDVEEPTITPSTKSALVAVTDISNNDKRALDEKDLFTKLDENVGVGCYLYMDGYYWLVVYEEHEMMRVKKHYIIRRCNNFITIPYKGRNYKIPVSIENLTMYSDGVADNKYTSIMDSKKQLWYGSNPVTRSLVENYRVLLPHRTAFRITHINDFEYNGLIKSLVLQTAVIEGDNFKTMLAANHIHDKKNEKKSDSIKIKGNKNILSGEEIEYEIDVSKNIPVKWEITNDKHFSLEIINEYKITLIASADIKDIGKTTKLIAKNSTTNEIIDEIEIKIRR